MCKGKCEEKCGDGRVRLLESGLGSANKELETAKGTTYFLARELCAEKTAALAARGALGEAISENVALRQERESLEDKLRDVESRLKEVLAKSGERTAALADVLRRGDSPTWEELLDEVRETAVTVENRDGFIMGLHRDVCALLVKHRSPPFKHDSWDQLLATLDGQLDGGRENADDLVEARSDVCALLDLKDMGAAPWEAIRDALKERLHRAELAEDALAEVRRALGDDDAPFADDAVAKLRDAVCGLRERMEAMANAWHINRCHGEHPSELTWLYCTDSVCLSNKMAAKGTLGSYTTSLKAQLDEARQILNGGESDAAKVDLLRRALE